MANADAMQRRLQSQQQAQPQGEEGAPAIAQQAPQKKFKPSPDTMKVLEALGALQARPPGEKREKGPTLQQAANLLINRDLDAAGAPPASEGGQ